MSAVSAADAENPLKGVEAFVFDVWGTVVNWRKGVAEHLRAFFDGKLDEGGRT